jgi:hypothetical protein
MRLAERLLAEMDLHPALLILLPRLDRAFHQKVTKKILTRPGISADPSVAIWQLTKIEQGDLAGPQELLASPVYRSLKSELAKGATNADAAFVLAALNALAVVATAEAARVVLDDIADSCQILRANPALAFLRLNAGLVAGGEGS